MARLRAPGGCPWDREQTFDSIKPYTLQETYEVLDAIERRDWDDLCSELGDFILQAVFFAGDIGGGGEAASISAMRARCDQREAGPAPCPHVFADESAETGDQVLKRWDEIKAEEQKSKAEAPQGLLATVPRALPALVEAQQISSRAARVGFDWRNIGEVFAKLDEERAEFSEACERGSQDQIEDELGDLLFVLVNLARFVKVDPEQALRRTNAKFRQRFGHVERRVEAQGNKTVTSTPIEDLEAFWQEAKG